MNTLIFLETTVEELSSWPYYANIGIGLLVALLQAVLIVILTKIVVDKALRRSKSIGDGLSKIGIEKVEVKSGKLTKRDQNVLFGRNGKQKPSKLKICYLTGINFINNYKDDLIELVKSGITIQVLIMNPTLNEHYEEFANDLKDFDVNKDSLPDSVKDKIIKQSIDQWELNQEGLEKLAYSDRMFLMVSQPYINKLLNGKKYEQLTYEQKYDLWNKRLNAYGNHTTELIISTKVLKEINSHAANGGKVELHYYLDEYQMPITFAEYDYGESRKNKSFVMLWTNMNAPVRETITSINVLAMKDGNRDASYVDDVSISFDYLINKYPKNYLED